MVEVFRTNVEHRRDADALQSLLLQIFPSAKFNFDLHDCDRILRVEGETLNITGILLLVRGKGFGCEILE